MTRLPQAFAIALLFTLGACGAPDAPVDETRPDAASPAPDAGDNVPDAGEEPPDAGADPVDAGEDVPDAGEDPVDAGEDVPDAGEDPATRLDSDCDGLNDLVERTTTLTDPLDPDTDGDGLSDGLERGVTAPVDGTDCALALDADEATTTDPLSRDTDGDGIDDGLEDLDRNGRVDAGEFDPAVADAPPVTSACAADGLRGVHLAAITARRSLALAPEAAVVQVLDGEQARGFVALVASGVALVALELPAPDGVTDLATLDRALRPALESVGTVKPRIERTRRLDDGTPALRLTFDATTTLDLAAHANALVEALAPGTTGRLAATSLAPEVRVEATLALPADGSTLVLLAVSPAAAPSAVARNFVSAATLSDVATGSRHVCELVPARPARVDLLLVVDDSGSMARTHADFGAALSSLTAQLDAAGTDWRIAAVTTSYHFGNGANSGRIRGFTRNVNTVRAWFTQNSTCTAGVCAGVPTTPAPATCPGGAGAGANGGCWVGVGGNGSEGLLGAARKAVDDLAPATQTEEAGKLRADASLFVVLLGDADDQTSGPASTADKCGQGGTVDRAGSGCEPVSQFVDYFGAPGATTVGNPTGRPVVVHGLVCPSGSACGCTSGGACTTANGSREFNPQPVDGLSSLRHGAVVRATGGVLGAMLSAQTVAFGLNAVARDVVARTGRPVRFGQVATDALHVAAAEVANTALCDPADVPPGAVDGYDVDAEYGTLAFSGACRPGGDGAAAVSYVQRVVAP